MMRSGSFLRLTAFLFACSTIAGWHSACADESSKTAATLDEIVVTAQKREERASDVPQSITAISGDILRSSDAQTLADLSARVPGMTVTGSGGVGANQIILRGITSGSDISPSVAVYIDDTPYGGVTAQSRATNTAFEMGAFDLDRVEVLRGPQGTLYGAAAFGGLVKYVLTPPSLQSFQTTVQLDGSDTDGGGFNSGVRAAVNLPLIADTLAVRMSVVRNHDAGFIDNAFSGASNINASTATAARLSVLAKPVDWLSLRATVLGQGIDRDGSNQIDFNAATRQPAFGDLTQSSRIAQPFTQRYRLYSLGGDADVGFGTASLTVSRQNSQTQFVQEAPLYTHSLGPVLAKLGHPIDDTSLSPSPSSNITTAEARLASNPGSALEWQGGLYYTDEANDYANAIVGYLNGTPIPYTIATYSAPTSYKEYAEFGDVTYHFTHSLDAQLGARFSRNDQDIAETYSPGLVTGPTVSGIQSSENVATYLATARYHFNDTNMAYARIASGYRPGGPNVQVVDPVTGTVRGGSAYQPDTLWNYELGVKLALNDVLTLDTSVFHIDWKNIQLQSVVDGLTAFVNGGRAKSDGVETALSYRPLRDLTLSATATYTNARLADAVPSIKAASGERLPNAPRSSAAARADYRTSLGSDWTGFAGASWSYIGNRTVSYDASLSPLQYELPAYQTVDLRLGGERAGWGVTFYVRNACNARGQISADTTFNLPNYRISIIEPRTVGALLTVTF
jgi:outer membrane receptor protein involved in Fe transport